MKFPKINKQARKSVNIPEFMGGLNLRESPTHCNDNQLTDMLNLWYKDGALRTRPGMNNGGTELIENSASYSQGDCMAEDMKCHEIFEDIYNNATGKEGRYQLCTVLSCYSDKSCISLFWCGADEMIKLPQLVLDGKAVNSYFVVKHNEYLYCFVNINQGNSFNGEIHRLQIELNGIAISDYGSSINWTKLSEEDVYIPLAVHHCVTDASYGMSYSEIVASGAMLEGFNMLSNKYRMIYSAYNKNIAADVHNTSGEVIRSKVHYMRYSLLSSVRVGDTVTAKYTYNGVTYTHTVSVSEDTRKGDGGWYWEEALKDDDLYMCVLNNVVIFVSSENIEGTAYVTSEGQTEDNLEITAVYHGANAEKQKIFGMRKATWFGGGSEGLAGGTRLFLCGNDGNEKSLVCWSGLNNPLYFPENAYFYVGDEGSEVTGFGKQSDMLIIFKKYETWFTRYNQNTSISASDLIDQSVIDLQSSAVYFPLTCINPYIGCAYPNTVQLCRNRLVWLGNDKQVYTLVTNNQYNERSIFAVSEMVNPKLKKESFSNVAACDWNGYYCLSIENKLYLMDYNSYGYIYVSSHSKTEDANIKIPWYYWELPKSGEMNIIHAADNKLCFMCYIRQIKYYSDKLRSYVIDLDLEEHTDNGEPIKSMAQTKFFDFGAQNYFKNISSVGLSLGYNGGEEITVTYLTDGGEAQDSIILEDGADERSAEFIKSVVLNPCIYSSVRFGLRLEAAGNMIIDGMNLDYRILGRSR